MFTVMMSNKNHVRISPSILFTEQSNMKKNVIPSLGIEEIGMKFNMHMLMGEKIENESE